MPGRGGGGGGGGARTVLGVKGGERLNPNSNNIFYLMLPSLSLSRPSPPPAPPSKPLTGNMERFRVNELGLGG